MNSESSQDGYLYFKDGEKDIMSYEEKEFLAFEECSTTENQSIDSFTSSDHSVSDDESEEKLIRPVCVATPQPEPPENMDSIPPLDFVIENWPAWSLSGSSMSSPKVVQSHAGNSVGGIQVGGPVSPREIPDLEMVSKAAQERDLESEDDTNAFQQSNKVHNEPPHPPKAALPDVGHQLKLFHNEQLAVQAISIWEINDNPERTNQEDFAFNGIDIAGHLLEAAAAQMEQNVIVHESALMSIANGLQLSIECGTGEDNPIVHRGIGPMVADILLDSQTGIVMGFAVARLVSIPIVNSSGGVQGSVIHQVTRGFAIDDNARHIITEGVGTAIWMVNQPSVE